MFSTEKINRISVEYRLMLRCKHELFSIYFFDWMSVEYRLTWYGRVLPLPGNEWHVIQAGNKSTKCFKNSRLLPGLKKKTVNDKARKIMHWESLSIFSYSYSSRSHGAFAYQGQFSFVPGRLKHWKSSVAEILSQLVPASLGAHMQISCRIMH